MAAAGSPAGRIGARVPGHDRDQALPRPARVGPGPAQTYAGPWLPEPVAEDDIAAIERADSLSLAFLVLLEELTPLERATYLLHDVFGYSFDEVAVSLGRTPAACRQLGAPRSTWTSAVGVSTRISSTGAS